MDSTNLAQDQEATIFIADLGGQTNLASLIIDSHYDAPAQDSSSTQPQTAAAGKGSDSGDEDDIVMVEDDKDYDIIVKSSQKKHGVKSKHDFNLLSVIGQGSYGKVYLVQEKGKEDELYAMKELKKEVLKKKNQIEHTKTER